MDDGMETVGLSGYKGSSVRLLAVSGECSECKTNCQLQVWNRT